MTYSVILKSQLEGVKRLDAEYYQPEFLDVTKKLKSIKTKTIGEVSNSVLNFGAYSLCNYINWKEQGVPYLNVENIKDGFVDFDGVKFIDEKVNEILKKSQVKEGEVILTMAGTIGNAAVARNFPSKVNSNQATAKISLKKGFSPYFLTAFLSCYYGKKQTEREIVSSVQPNIFLGQIKDFKIPVVSGTEQKEIEKLYKNGLNELENSKTFYSQAKGILLKELGLENFGSEESLYVVVNLSEVKKNKRMDAEFFNSGWQALERILKKLKIKKLGELVEMKKGIEPGAEEYKDEGKQFIRVSSLSKDGINQNDQKKLSDELYQELKKNYQPEIGEILLTKDATPGIAYVLKENMEGIMAGGVLRLKLKEKIEAEYLALILNSLVGQTQAERDAGGSVIKHWKPEQIKNVLIPIISEDKQKIISDLIKKSFAARNKAKELLDEAKSKVEEMIENN